MPNPSKSRKKAAAVPKAEFTDFFAPLYVNGVARVAKLQKTSLDLAAEQTAEWIGAWKQAFNYFPGTAPTFLFDIFGQAVQTCVEAQKSALDLAVEQTQAVADIAKQRGDAYLGITEGVKKAFQTTVSRSVEAQKKVLDIAEAQNKALCQVTKRQIGVGPAAAIVDTFERGADKLIETQKSILDASAKAVAI